MNRRLRLGLAAIGLCLLASCGTATAGQRLSIATGGSGGVYYVFGGGLAEQITENLEGFEATAEVTSASVDNMFLIQDGKSDIAFSLADTAADAVRGREAFEGEPINARALARLYSNITQVVTTEDSGITSVEELEGKRVSVGSPNSGTEVIALRVLHAAGLDPREDISAQQLGVGESVQAVKDGSLDAFFWSGGVPTGAVTDLATSRSMVILPTAQYAAALKEQYGDFYLESTIEPGKYQGVDAEVPVIAVPNYLVVNASMDPDLAYEITKLLFERKKELAQVHPAAERTELETATQVEPMELHPGAQRYYDEQK